MVLLSSLQGDQELASARSAVSLSTVLSYFATAAVAFAVDLAIVVSVAIAVAGDQELALTRP